jgi:hypothetical protein
MYSGKKNQMKARIVCTADKTAIEPFQIHPDEDALRFGSALDR